MKPVLRAAFLIATLWPVILLSSWMFDAGLSFASTSSTLAHVRRAESSLTGPTDRIAVVAAPSITTLLRTPCAKV